MVVGHLNVGLGKKKHTPIRILLDSGTTLRGTITTETRHTPTHVLCRSRRGSPGLATRR